MLPVPPSTRIFTGDPQALIGVSGAVLGYFLPVLLILMVTSEWSQRTGLTTFTLEPHRGRVVGAKFVAGLIRRAIEAGNATGHIFNLGHGVLPTTDAGAITDAVAMIHEA